MGWVSVSGSGEPELAADRKPMMRFEFGLRARDGRVKTEASLGSDVRVKMAEAKASARSG